MLLCLLLAACNPEQQQDTTTAVTPTAVTPTTQPPPSALPASATLRLYAIDNNSAGFSAHGVGDNNWIEQSIAFNNAPAIANPLSASGPVAVNTWVEVDVTTFVNSAGVYSLALTGNAGNLLRLRSREHSLAPQLVIVTAP